MRNTDLVLSNSASKDWVRAAASSCSFAISSCRGTRGIHQEATKQHMYKNFCSQQYTHAHFSYQNVPHKHCDHVKPCTFEASRSCLRSRPVCSAQQGHQHQLAILEQEIHIYLSTRKASFIVQVDN